jgi:hypothetical protein
VHPLHSQHPLHPVLVGPIQGSGCLKKSDPQCNAGHPILFKIKFSNRKVFCLLNLKGKRLAKRKKYILSAVIVLLIALITLVCLLETTPR